MADDEMLDEQTDETQLDEEQEGEVEAEESLEEKLKEAVDVSVEDLGGLRKKLTITVPQDTITEQLDDQYQELRNEAMVPGFRKGRAPRRLLEKRFGNEVSDTLVQQLVGTGYMAAVDKTELKVIGDPLIWAKEKDAESETLMDVQKAIELIELPKDDPLTFACEVEVRPEFELPELKGIPLTKPVITVTDENVDEQVNRIRGMRGHYETVSDSAVEQDDVVIADLKMSSEGTVLKEEESVRMAARPQAVDGVALENLGEALTGANVGDVRTTSGEISDDYIKAEFRGKTAEFEIKVREIQRLQLPELNEEFIKGLGFETEEELREWTRSELESRLDEQVRQSLVAQVYDYLADETKVELPERLSKSHADRVMVRRMLDLYRQGVPPAETEKLLDELKTRAREEAARDLQLFFIMDKLAEEYDVDVSEGEVNGLIAAIAQRRGERFDRVRDELTREGGLTNLYIQLRDEKIVGQLIEDATITESESTAEAGGEKKAKKKGGKSASPEAEASEGGAEHADET